MSLELKKVVVGLSEEAFKALRISAQIHGRDLGEEAREALTEHYLGKLHGIKVTAARFAVAEILGKGS